MKMSTQIAIWFIAFNAIAGVVVGMGVADELGVQLDTGDTGDLEEYQQPAEPNLGAGAGATLFGMYNALTGQVWDLFYSIFAGMAMLKIFLPNIWVDALSVIVGAIVTKDIIGFARGEDL